MPKISEYDQVTDITESEEFVVNQNGTTKKITLQQIRETTGVNLIGVAGAAGFGVGICPADELPSGFTPLSGYADPSNANYGNYQFSDGSVMVWVPKFYYKVGTGTNGLAVNVIDIKGIDTYDSTSQANAAGYALHRAFIDGGAEQSGFFFDKYQASKNLVGANYVASSIKNGNPISTAAAHNPITDLTGISVAQYYSAIDAAKARGTGMFCAAIFMYSALQILSIAHGQAATSTTNCAWYLANKNYPKGNNNNALADTDDATVTFVSDGYASNSAKTGSGTTFAKTTHNGQDCGVTDLNGNMYEIAIGITCIATTAAIGGMSTAAACEITWTSHGLVDGDLIMLLGITQADWSGAKDKIWQITKTGDNTFTIPFDSSGFAVAYDAGTDPGTVAKGTFYAAKQATAMRSFTSGATLATDHWGATGVAAMMDAMSQPPFETVYPNNGFAQRWGSGANQVLDEATSGAGWLRTACMMPKSKDGIDTTGTNLFGKDYFYQYIVNLLCAVVGGSWGSTADAGVGYVYWNSPRATSGANVGFRAACFC